MASIRAGVIGAGFIGPAHVEALRRLGNVEVAGLATSSTESARLRAEALHVPRVYPTWQDLVADSRIDVVHNCTPNYLHRAVTLAALQAGKVVVTEKPLGVSSRETRELWEAARRAGVIHAVVFNYRAYPLVQQARAAIAAGDLGDVRLVHGVYLQDWLLWDTDYNWRVESSLGGPSRAMADIGSHWADLAQYVSGRRITSLCADLATFIPVRRAPPGARETFAAGQVGELGREIRMETEDYGALLLEFEGGTRGSAVISQVSPGHRNDLRLEIDGARQSMAWCQEEPNSLWIGRRDGPNSVLPKDPALLRPEARPYAHYPGGHGEAYPDGLKNLLANVYRAVAGGRTPSEDEAEFPTFRDGHRAVLVVEAILASHRQRGWVPVAAD